MKNPLSKATPNAPCPCGSERRYMDCCGPWHQGLQAQPAVHAPTPEALMRSRYSAYVLALGDYLLATWHASSAPGEIDFPPTKWLGLEVRSAQTQGDAGVVEFIARYRDSSGRAGRIEETSRFVRIPVEQTAQTNAEGQMRWLYVDGEVI